jgi:hypothetical protein
MFIRSLNDIGGTPPDAAALTSVMVQSSSQIDLLWTDLSDDAWGFKIERSTAGGAWESVTSVDVDVEAYSDTGLLPATYYEYRIIAFNGSGEGVASNIAGGTTEPGGGATLDATGYKVKGRQHANLVFSGLGTETVYVFRDDALLSSNAPSNAAYHDDIGAKGGGSYTYQVCEDEEWSICTNEDTIVF